ncbi:endophilin-B1 isoform X2 [Strongylocentrotus purpuratus]|uniref:Endophilin-B1 n=1 Tax=Strongylocentrotus purpuratus TaxID=7668 RepID=A0A7M7HFN0_STRPU|nr:endophilin-B1 isoform X2 [Strongylocentrotus purpuratus]|eukprot:XP_011671846.1 PREDICTED: endophilin-B1 isoform X2 [Strongylocentrotus purpuratus]
MDKLKSMASGAGTFINRTVQYTEEKLGNAEKTELDARFENLLQRADRTRLWTEQILAKMGAVLEPNPNSRMEDFVNTKLDRRARDRESNSEQFGSAMIDGGNELGPGTQYGATLIQVGQSQRKIGQIQREYVQSSLTNYIVPLRTFLEGDMKTITKERKILENVRLDLDAAKGKVRKARSAEASKAPNHEEMIKAAEAELRKAQADFDRQYEITTLLLEGITSAHSTHLERLKDFVEAEQTYYAQCSQTMTELQQQLGNIPGTMGGIRPPRPVSGPPQGVATATPTPSAPPLDAMLPEDKSRPQKGVRKAKVLYDYDAGDDSELSVLADEVITVYSLPGMDSDWMMGERGSQRGKVPLTYMELL